MRFFSLTLVVVCCLIGSAQAQINICDTFTVLKYEPIPVAVTPGHFIDGYKISIDDVEYHITVNKKRRVEFVSTSDTAFHLGTVGVGTPYVSIPKKMIRKEQPNEGWGYEVILKNGWIAVFGDPVVHQTLKASRKSKITWFYKAGDCKVYHPVND